jgi:hypothetical protein
MRTNTVLPALLFALGALAPRASAAQTAETLLRPGAWVHVSVREPEFTSEITGLLLELEADSVVLRPEGYPVAVKVSRARVARMEVSTGRMSPGEAALRSGMIGAGVGIVLSASFGLAMSTEEQKGDFVLTRRERVLMGASFAGTVLGAGGAVLGLLSPPERWRRVNVPESTSLRVSGADGGVALSVSVKL